MNFEMEVVMKLTQALQGSTLVGDVLYRCLLETFHQNGPKYKVLLLKNNHIVPINMTCLTRKHLVGSHRQRDGQNRRGYSLLFMRQKNE